MSACSPLRKRVQEADLECDTAAVIGTPFVMGIQGRTGRRHLLLSGVAERVAHLAPCPMR